MEEHLGRHQDGWRAHAMRETGQILEFDTVGKENAWLYFQQGLRVQAEKSGTVKVGTKREHRASRQAVLGSRRTLS